MANILSGQPPQAILSLAAQGRSIRRIARELNVHRQTVRQYLAEDQTGSKGTTLSTPGATPKCTHSTAGKIGRKSLGQSFGKLIEEKAGRGLTAQRIYPDRKLEVQFTGSYQSVKRLVRELHQADPQRVWRIEVGPAEEAQGDFGVGAPILSGDGRKRKTWVFRIVLSYSRKA